MNKVFPIFPRLSIVSVVKIFLLVLGCSLIFSCKKATINPLHNKSYVAACPSTTPVNLQLAYQQTQEIYSCSGQQLNVIFTNLVQDSRCPSDVNCPWAGTAYVGFTFSGISPEVVIELNKSAEVDWNGYTILVKFTQLDPYPLAAVPTNINDYIATLEFSLL